MYGCIQQFSGGENVSQALALNRCALSITSDSSELDLNCRAHEVHNLYVVDSSFFPSHASVSPGLTVIANALRVGDRLIEQLK